MIKKICLFVLDKLAPFIKSDKFFLELKYWLKMGKFLNLRTPIFYTEKLQWLKLYDRNPLYQTLVDKYEVKNYITRIIGNEYVIPQIGIWDNYNDIVFEDLPNSFVLKTTHAAGSSGVVICKDKNNFNYQDAKRKLTKSLANNAYWVTREWPYKNIPHRIIAEKYLTNDEQGLRDYKFYCFSGVPKVLLVASNRFSTHNFNYFDMDFNELPIVSRDGPRSNTQIEKPLNFNKMKDIATRLSKGITHVRVDLYNVNGYIYFGELTFYDSSGYDDFSSEEWNTIFGNWLTLPNNRRV